MTQDDTLEPTTIRTEDSSRFVLVDTYNDDGIYLGITLSGGSAWSKLSFEQVDQLIAALQARIRSIPWRAK